MNTATRTRWRTVLSWTGHLLAFAGAGYVLWRLTADLQGLHGKTAWASVVATIALAVPVCTALLFLLAAGWHRMLVAAGADNLRWRHAWRLVGITQLGKYVPGNVLHVALRHERSRRHDVAHAPLIGSALLEVVGVLVASLAVGALFAPAMLAAHLDVAPWGWWVGGIAALALPCIGWLALGRGSLRRAIPVAAGLGCYAAFFIGAGLLGYVVLLALSGSGLATPTGVIGAFAIAWALGFATPGAPGGLGVRDAALLILLGGASPAAETALFVVVLRVITLLADVAFFGVAAAAERTGRDKHVEARRAG